MKKIKYVRYKNNPFILNNWENNWEKCQENKEMKLILQKYVEKNCQNKFHIRCSYMKFKSGQRLLRLLIYLVDNLILLDILVEHQGIFARNVKIRSSLNNKNLINYLSNSFIHKNEGFFEGIKTTHQRSQMIGNRG